MESPASSDRYRPDGEVQRPQDQIQQFHSGVLMRTDFLRSHRLQIGVTGIQLPNWGVVAAAHFDLVPAIFEMKFGETSALSSVVYRLVGLYQAVSFKEIRNGWAHSLPARVH